VKGSGFSMADSFFKPFPIAGKLAAAASTISRAAPEDIVNRGRFGTTLSRRPAAGTCPFSQRDPVAEHGQLPYPECAPVASIRILLAHDGLGSVGIQEDDWRRVVQIASAP
jgi:hypothetical protein